MSIKLFYGYKIPYTKLNDIKNFFDKVRPVYEKIRNNYLKIYTKEEDCYTKEEYCKIWVNHNAKKFNNIDNFIVEFAVFPHADFTIFLDLSGYFYKNEINLLEQFNELEDFSYWNNTDQLDNVSDEDWENRKKVWEKVYPDNWSVKDSPACFIYTLLNHFLPMYNELNIC